MTIRETEGIGSALAAVVWSQLQYVTLPAGSAGLGNEPDPLKILVVRRFDGACASMALPPPVRAAFSGGLERNVVLQHAPALQACVRLGLSGLVLRPGTTRCWPRSRTARREPSWAPCACSALGSATTCARWTSRRCPMPERSAGVQRRRRLAVHSGMGVPALLHDGP